MTNPQTDALEPCPFCGLDDYQTWGHVRDGRSLGCSNCGARFVEYNGPPDNTAENRLITAWNTRPAEQDLKDEIQRLNKWADEFSNRQIEERRTGELYQNELKARIAELEVAQGWQPIETCEILLIGDSALICTKNGVRTTAVWVGGGWMRSGECLHPTHWMPLPPTPQ